MIGVFQSAMPGSKLERIGRIDATGQMVRFSWRLIDATGRQFASGTNICDFCIDGRVASISGFVDSALTSRDWSVEKYAAFWAAPGFSKPTDELAASIKGYWPGPMRRWKVSKPMFVRCVSCSAAFPISGLMSQITRVAATQLSFDGLRQTPMATCRCVSKGWIASGTGTVGWLRAASLATIRWCLR
jgi:hypothetical protein